MWCCSCACCGYLCTFQIYTGAGNSPERGLAKRVVKDLVHPHYGGKGHVVYADNYFTCFCLCNQLLQQQTYLTGTIRSTSKDFPKEVQNNVVLKKSLAKHEYRSIEREGVTFLLGKTLELSDLSLMCFQIPLAEYLVVKRWFSDACVMPISSSSIQ